MATREDSGFALPEFSIAGGRWPGRRGEPAFWRIFDGAPIGITLGRADGRFLRVNPAFCAMLRRPREELVGETFQAVTHPDDLEAELVEIERLLAGEVQGYQLEKRYLAAEGPPVWAIVSTSLAAVERGHHYLISHVQDITERRRSEEALRESERLLRLVADHAPDIIYRYRFVPDRGFEYVSPAATAMTGYTPQDHYADPDLISKLVHPDDRERLRAVQRQSAHTEPLLLRWHRKDGTEIWAEQRHVPVLDEQGRLVAVEGIAREVTEQRRTEEALWESEARFRALFHYAPLGLAVVDLKGELLEVNPAFCALVGLSSDRLVGRCLGTLLHPFDACEYAKLFSAVSQGERESVELCVRLCEWAPDLVPGDECKSERPRLSVGRLILSPARHNEGEARSVVVMFAPERAPACDSVDLREPLREQRS